MSAFLGIKFACNCLIKAIAIAIEHMLVDALLSAEPHMKFAKKIFEPEEYLHLTDAIMPQIESSKDSVTNPSFHSSCMFDSHSSLSGRKGSDNMHDKN